jgi:hypothetical protein
MTEKKYNNLAKAVIELNGTEYVIDELAATMIEKGMDDIALTRLLDHVVTVFTLKEIQDSIDTKGIIDHLS